jgi:hypothetical protein
MPNLFHVPSHCLQFVSCNGPLVVLVIYIVPKLPQALQAIPKSSNECGCPVLALAVSILMCFIVAHVHHPFSDIESLQEIVPDYMELCAERLLQQVPRCVKCDDK